MTRGKQTCRILKEIRRRIAEANDIHLITAECNYKGDCPGTCPRCEAEVAFLEQQLRARSRAGKAVAIAGISAGLLLMSGSCTASANDPTENRKPALEQTECDDSIINVAGMIQRVAQYPGGDEAFYQFISENLFPEGSPFDDIDGTVTTKLEVDEKGRITKVEIMDSTLPEAVAITIRDELERVVRLMPNLQPATIGGKPTTMSFALPLTFKPSPKQGPTDGK